MEQVKLTVEPFKDGFAVKGNGEVITRTTTEEKALAYVKKLTGSKIK